MFIEALALVVVMIGVIYLTLRWVKQRPHLLAGTGRSRLATSHRRLGERTRLVASCTPQPIRQRCSSLRSSDRQIG